MENVCRLCAKEKKLAQLVHSIQDQRLNVEQKLKDCCRWNSYSNENYELPTKICNACYRRLESSWSFAESVAQAQQQLLTLIEDIKPKTESIEYVTIVSTADIKEEPNDLSETSELNAEDGFFASNVLNAEDGTFASSESVKEIEPMQSDEPDETYDTFEEFKVVIETQNTNTFMDDDSISSIEVDYNIPESDDAEQIEDGRIEEEPQPKMQRYDSRKIDFDALRKKRLQRLPGSLSRLCDTCGKYFASITALQRHIKIHKGEAPHVCKTCGKRFRTTYNLKVCKRIMKLLNLIGFVYNFLFFK